MQHIEQLAREGVAEYGRGLVASLGNEATYIPLDEWEAEPAPSFEGCQGLTEALRSYDVGQEYIVALMESGGQWRRIQYGLALSA